MIMLLLIDLIKIILDTIVLPKFLGSLVKKGIDHKLQNLDTQENI